MAEFLRVRDERLNTSDINEAKYMIKEGPRTSYTILPPQNVNTGNLVYQLNNVGPNVGRNRQIWVNPQTTTVITGTGFSSVTQGLVALKAWPFNRQLSQSQHTLNGATETYLTNQIIDFIARIKTYATATQCYDNTQPDNSTDYLTGISNISPLTNYTSSILGNGVYHPRNVGIVSAVVSGAGTILTITCNWWEPLITPFSAVADNVKNLPPFYAIDGETVNLVFANALNDLFAINTTGITITNSVTTLNSCNMYLEYVTSRDLVLPPVSLYQFPKYQRFQSQITTGSLAPSSGSVTVQVNAQTMPSKIICFIRCPESSRDEETPDCYASITGMQVQLDNGTTLLNGASQRKLYDISVQNGLIDTFPVFAQYNLAGVTGGSYFGSGSVVILDPAKDLSITQEEGMTNGSAGKYTIQILMNYSNAVNIDNATAYVFCVNNAVLIREGRSYVSKLLAYSREEVSNAKNNADFVEMGEYDDAKQNNLFLSGGSLKSFFKKVWKNRHKLEKRAVEYKKNKRGHMLGGYSMGGEMEDDVKMYYD
jgi:hypothetical protein